MQCNGVKGFYAQLTGEDLSLLYIYIYIYICHRHENGFGKRDNEILKFSYEMVIWRGLQQVCR